MEEKRGWRALAGIIVCSIVLLLGGYGGAYYATVKRELTYFTSFTGCPIPYYAATYPAIPWADPIFGPMHRLDVGLRRNFWTVPVKHHEHEEDEAEETESVDDDPAQPSEGE